MGLCKCRKITDLYCFKHKKPVCENCIVSDHRTCHVDTYIKWLTDSEILPPTCVICKGELTPDSVVRLSCLHCCHIECLELHGSSFPPNTARAGFTCPVPGCNTPLVPPNANSPLSYLLYKHIENAAWFDSKSLNVEHQDEGPYSSDTTVDTVDGVSQRDSDTVVKKDISTHSRKVQRINVVPVSNNNGNNVENNTLTLRPDPIFDDDADKYNKNSFARLIYPPATSSPLLGLAGPGKRRSPIRFTMKRMLIVFALCSTLLIVALLSTSLE